MTILSCLVNIALFQDRSSAQRKLEMDLLGISLILERSMAPEALREQGVEALIFAVVYGIGLWVYHRYFKKEG